MNKPTVMCLIGSTKLKQHIMGVAQRETLRGKIVLIHGFFHHVDMVPITEAQKRNLDTLMLRKIDMADEVFVVNVNGYIGSSTQSGIEYALATNKPVQYLEGEGNGS